MIEKFELQYKTGTSLTGVITGNDRDACSTLYYITGPISHERLQTIRGFLVNITMCVISRGDYRR